MVYLLKHQVHRDFMITLYTLCHALSVYDIHFNSKILSMEFYLQTMAGSSPGEGTPVRVLHCYIVKGI
jgi:hypothetical protein